jgi:hypothetical protein
MKIKNIASPFVGIYPKGNQIIDTIKGYTLPCHFGLSEASERSWS